MDARYYVYLAAVLIGIFLILVYSKGANNLLGTLVGGVKSLVLIFQGRNPRSGAAAATPYAAAA